MNQSCMETTRGRTGCNNMIYIEKHNGEIFIGNNTDLSRNITDAGIAFAIEHS